MALVFSFFSPHFLSVENFKNILTASSVIGLMAVGATFVIASGAIDLSTAAVMALSGVAGAWCLQQFHLSVSSVLLVSALIGMVCGMLTGLLVVVTQAPSFIVTLGMLSVVRALAYIWTDGIPIYGLDDSITATVQDTWLGLPTPIALFVACTLFASGLLSQTKFGLQLLALGDSQGAAIAMGLPVARLQVQVFALAGIFSGIAGFIFTARTNSGDPSAGQSYELMAITAVILGGANLFGGRSSILGTFVGVLCLGMLQNGLNLLAISTFYQILFVGCILIAAAFLRRVGVDR